MHLDQHDGHGEITDRVERGESNRLLHGFDLEIHLLRLIIALVFVPVYHKVLSVLVHELRSNFSSVGTFFGTGSYYVF
jgi:hypothetical protein